MTQQNIEFKAIPGQFNIDEAQGMVECFVAGIGNKDSVGDVLISGAFTKSLTRRKPRVVWGHNWNDPIGKVLEIYEVAPGDRRLPMKMLNAGIGGLYARVQFNLNSEKGREAFANVAFFGQEQEWSIGYKTLDAIFDPNLQANILKEVELYEVSPVLHGANQLTGTISVKSDETAVLEEEKGGMMMVGMPGMAGRPTGMMHHGPGMMHHGRKPTPNILEANKPGIGDERKNQLEIELAIRAGSPVKVRLAEENTVIFDRMSPEGQPTTYRVSYHFTGKEFMFGKPEKVSVQTVYVPSSEESGSRVVVPSQMPSMPMQVKPSGNAYLGDDDDEYQNIMPKSYGEEKWDFDDEIADLANILSDSLDVKVGRALSAKNMSKLKTILQNLQDVISSAEKDVDTKSDFIIPVPVEQAFETKQLLDPIFDYHRVESHVTEDGIVVTSGVTVEFIEAVGVAEKALGQRLGGGLGKLGRAARGAARFDPKAWDGDGDGLVQEGTPFQRPAIPGINDRLTGGRVDAEAATRAYRQDAKKPSSKKPNRQGLASMGKPEPLKREGEFHGGNVYDEFNGQYVEGEVIALSDIYGDDTPGYGVVGRYDSDGTGTIDYFYGGDDEEFESIEDAMDFLENVENEAENDRFYNDESFRSLDRVRSAGKPGARPLAGLASSSEVVQRPESVQGEIVSGPGAITPAMKEIQREVDNGWINPKHQEILDEILADVTPEKLSSEEAGKVLSDVRRKFFEAVNNGELDDYRGVKMQEDNLNDYLTQQISTAIKDSVFETINANIAKERNSKRRKLLEDNRDDLLDAWGGVIDDGLKRIRDNKPVTDKKIASAKKDAAESRKNVIADLSDGSTTDEPQEFWYRIDDIIMDDPSIDSEELLKELREAVLKGIKEDPDNQALKEIQDELGENENRLKELVGELEEAKLRSDYYPDTVKSRRARAGGLASSSYGTMEDEDNFESYDEAFGPRPPRTRRGMAEDSVGDAAAENIDRDRNANAVRRGLASQSTVDGPGSIVDRSLSRTGRAPTESGTTMQDSEILKDFLKGMTAKQINEKYRLGGEMFAKKAANREMARLRRNSQSEANSNMDIVMYRAAGLSPKDTAKLFGLSPRDVRKRERKLISALREETDDDDLLYLRSGLSLEQVGKLLGEDPIDIRKREIAALKKRAQDRGDSRRDGLASGSRQMDMTLDEYIKLEDTLNKYIDDSQLSGVGADEDMQTIENLINKISDSQAANDAIELNDKEIDEYIDTLTRMRDFGPVEDSADKESIDKLIDSLKKTKDSKDGYFESDELRNLGTRLSVPENAPTKKPVKKVRAFRSSSGTINPHKKLDIELDENEIGALRDEVEMLSKFSDSPNVLRSVGQKLEKAKNGKFTIEADEYEDIVKSIEQAKSRGKIPSSDLLGVIEQTAETSDGKYSSRDIRGGGLASTNGGKRPNNGAPPDITEAMQKEYIFWAKSGKANNLKLVQEAVREFDANDGQLSSSMWKRLRTMYTSMGPGSASGGARRGIFGRGKDKDTSKPSGGPGFVIDSRPATPQGPISTDGWEKVGGQMGSQPGGKFKDPKTGKEYYIKEPKSRLHAENESLVTKLYERLGIGTGRVSVGDKGGSPKIVSEWLPGSQNVNHRSEMKDPKWKKKVQDSFVASAWLANWDATANSDNIVKGSDGNPYIIDSGGGLLFRARGEAKGARFGSVVGEMETLRDPSMNSLGAQYFGDMPPEDIARQVKEIGALSDGEIRQLVEGTVTDKAKAKEISDTLIARRDYLVQNWSTGKNSGAGRRSRSGLASVGDPTAEGRTARPGAPVARGIGEIAMQAGERGNFGVGKGGTIDDRKEEKFVGLSLDEAKPDNWDQLTNEEKFDWLMYEGHPDKASDKKNAISKAAHEGALKKVLDDIEREERKKMTPEQRRELRDAERDNPSEAELERQRVKREKEKTEAEKPKRTYKPAETAEKAKEVREKELDAFKEWIEDTKIQLGDMDYDGDFNPNTEDIWETVDALIGDNDMTKKSIDDAISALEDYVDTNAPENRYDRASVTRANALLKKLKTSRDKYEKDPWIADNRPGRDGLASSSRSRDGDRPRPGSREMPQSKAKRDNEMRNVFDLAQQVVAELRERQKQNADGGRRSRSGLASTSMPKTMITDEATYFKDIETSLQKEIRAAQKADDKKAIKGLTKLQEIIRRDEASKTGSRRTNVGSIYLTPDEADIILEGLMFALDKQIDAGGDKRIEWYSKLIEKISNAAMSTFINKTDRNVI